jgi:ribosome-binding protein aMBF1 (putative translation factor)
MDNTNWFLARTIRDAGMTQKVFAEKIGMAKSVLSQIVRGRLVPNEEEQTTIETALGKHDLFPKRIKVS